MKGPHDPYNCDFCKVLAGVKPSTDNSILTKIAEAYVGEKVERYAECGACGCERLVDRFMRRDYDSQFQARPHMLTDVFYCGCQSDDWW